MKYLWQSSVGQQLLVVNRVKLLLMISDSLYLCMTQACVSRSYFQIDISLRGLKIWWEFRLATSQFSLLRPLHSLLRPHLNLSPLLLSLLFLSLITACHPLKLPWICAKWGQKTANFLSRRRVKDDDGVSLRLQTMKVKRGLKSEKMQRIV